MITSNIDDSVFHCQPSSILVWWDQGSLSQTIDQASHDRPPFGYWHLVDGVISGRHAAAVPCQSERSCTHWMAKEDKDSFIPVFYIFVSQGFLITHICPGKFVMEAVLQPLLWAIAVSHCCEPLLWAIAVSHCCEPLLWAIAVSHCCEPLLWAIAVSHCCEPLLWAFAVSLCCEPMLWAHAVSLCCEPLLWAITVSLCCNIYD